MASSATFKEIVTSSATQLEALPVAERQRRGPQADDHTGDRAVGALASSGFAVVPSGVRSPTTSSHERETPYWTKASGLGAGLNRSRLRRTCRKKAARVNVR